ncbi:MAG: hypothetical protein FWE34_07320 [Defluviitaleaceae bacterium]|nr:hypothetical protein [Defluviitaleaceae bacterium]
MRIKNYPKIFYLTCGLLADGDRRYDRSDTDVAALAEKIHRAAQEVSLDADVLQWFNLAKTAQVDGNPYWPRGHAMLIAALYEEDSARLDIDQFMESLEKAGMTDPVGAKEFREWISRLPEILTYTESMFRGFWKEYCEIMFARTNAWMAEVEASRLPLKEFYGTRTPSLILAANLFANPFVADFVRPPNHEEEALIVIASKPDVENMLQEALRDKVAAHKKKIAAFCKTNGVAGFVDEEKMKDIGYIREGDITTMVHTMEDCFVRALSTILAGGGMGRMKSHINIGFSGLPAIAEYYEEHRPKAIRLGEFIDAVLEGMASS